MDAIETMSEGFVLLDAADRLVLCNSRYKELYRESAHALVPGAQFEDMLRAGLAHGQYPDAVGREDDWLAERLAARSEEQTSELQSLMRISYAAFCVKKKKSTLIWNKAHQYS